MLRTHLTVNQEVMELESRPTNWPLPEAEEEEAVVQREREEKGQAAKAQLASDCCSPSAVQAS